MHKIVTGRSADFGKLRQEDGLSGYPSRSESVHDFVENSHASTVLSYAHGMAVARDAGADSAAPHRRRGRRRLADRRHGLRGAEQRRPHQAARDHRAQRQRPQLRADGVQPRPTARPTWSPTSTAAPACPTGSPRSCRTASPTSASTPRTCAASDGSSTSCASCRSSARRPSGAWTRSRPRVREFLQPPSFFEALGVRYTGPIDGHNIEEMEHALHNAVELSSEGPDRRPRHHPEGPRATRRRRTTTRSICTTPRCSTR